MHQSSKQSGNTWQSRAIGFMQIIGVATVLALTSCTPKADNANDNAQVQSSPAATPTSPGTTTGTADTPSDMTVDPESTNVLDDQLVIKGAQDNLFEIEAGELALQRASNTEVKQFAQKMVQDHTQAKDLLQQVAVERNITLPTDMGDQNQAVFARLSELSGAEFDRAYMTEIVNSHQQDVALLSNQAQNGKDQALKAAAAENLPALKEHLKLAQELAQRLSSQ